MEGKYGKCRGEEKVSRRIREGETGKRRMKEIRSSRKEKICDYLTALQKQENGINWLREQRYRKG